MKFTPTYIHTKDICAESHVQLEAKVLMLLEEAEKLRDKLEYLIERQLVTSYSSHSRFTDLSACLPAVGIKPLGKREYEPVIYLQSNNSYHYLEPIKELNRREVDIQFIGTVSAYSSSGSRDKKIGIGASISHEQSGTGVIGCFVKKYGRDDLLILSNNHIMANENEANIGSPIFHPSIEKQDYLTKKSDFEFAFLESYTRLEIKNTNFFDSALAKVKCIDLVDPITLDGFGLLQGIFDSSIFADMPVAKIGSATELTSGSIQAVGINGMRIKFRTGVYRFSNLIAIESRGEKRFSSEGDSGALIFDELAGRAIALLVGGSEYGGHNKLGITYAIPIVDIMNNLGLELVRDTTSLLKS